MIADDMISFIKSDLKVFGLGVLFFLIVTWALYRQIFAVLIAHAMSRIFGNFHDGAAGHVRLAGHSGFIQLYIFATDHHDGDHDPT